MHSGTLIQKDDAKCEYTLSDKKTPLILPIYHLKPIGSWTIHCPNVPMKATHFLIALSDLAA